MRCGRCQNKLESYFAGELPPSDQTALEAHLAGCETCRQRADELRAIQAIAAARVDDWTPPPGFAAATQELAARANPSALAFARGRRLAEQPVALPGRRLLGFLWLGLAVLFTVLVALPPTRGVVRRPDLLDPRGASAAFESLGFGPLEVVVLRSRTRLEDLAATLHRIDQPWAYAVSVDASSEWDVWEQALEAASDDEVIPLRYAVRAIESAGPPTPRPKTPADWRRLWSALDRMRQAEPAIREVVGPLTEATAAAYARHYQAAHPGQPLSPPIATDDGESEEEPSGSADQDLWTHYASLRRATEAVRELTERFPDNAYAHYLRAYVEFARGDLPAFEQELRAGNAAPRYFTGRAETVRRATRLAIERGQPEPLAELSSSASLVFPELTRFRAMARGAAALAWERWRQGDRAAAVETDLLLAQLGERLRESGDTAIDMLVGRAIQAIAFGNQETRGKPPPGLDADATRWWPARQDARAFGERLRLVGRVADADWPIQQAERGIAVGQACLSMWDGSGPIGVKSIDKPLGRAHLLTLAALALGLQALALLLGCLLSLIRRRPRRARFRPLPWRGWDIALICALALPVTLLADYAAVRLLYLPPRSDMPAEGVIAVTALLAPLPLLLLFAILMALGGGYARRAGAPRWRVEIWLDWLLEAKPWSIAPRWDFMQRSWRSVALPLAAGLLYVALLLAVPIAADLSTATKEARGYATYERTQLAAILARENIPPGGVLSDQGR